MKKEKRKKGRTRGDWKIYLALRSWNLLLGGAIERKKPCQGSEDDQKGVRRGREEKNFVKSVHRWKSAENMGKKKRIIQVERRKEGLME